MTEMLKRLKEQRQRAWEAGKALLDVAEAEKRDLTTAEEAQWQRITADIDGIDSRTKELENAESRIQAGSQAIADLMSKPVVRSYGSGADQELDAAVRRMVLANDPSPVRVSHESVRSGYSPAIEARATAVTSGNVGTTFSNQLVLSLVQGGALLAAGATIVRTQTGEDLAVARQGNVTAGIVAEGAEITDRTPGYTPVTLKAYGYKSMAYVSNELATDAAYPVLQGIAQEFGMATGRAISKDGVDGSGTNEPTGLITAVTAGVTGAGTAPTADELIDLVASLDPAYLTSPAVAFLMNAATLAGVRKLKASGTGEYLFNLDSRGVNGSVGTLLGMPVFVEPNLPNAGAGAKSVLLGAFDRVYVRMVGDGRIERSDDFRFSEDIVSLRYVQRADVALIDPSAVKAFIGV